MAKASLKNLSVRIFLVIVVNIAKATGSEEAPRLIPPAYRNLESTHTHTHTSSLKNFSRYDS